MNRSDIEKIALLKGAIKKAFIALWVWVLPAALWAASERALFAGGCFWCMEPPFDRLDGVLGTVSGYSGGHTANPTYKSTSSGQTGHYEVVRVEYDPARVSYAQLLAVFWQNIDPFDAQGQFCDKGPQYRAAIFFRNEAERQAALKSKQAIQARAGDRRVVTEILPAKKFHAAEDYHQDYYRKNPWRYKYYRAGCGRDRRLDRIEALLNADRRP